MSSSKSNHSVDAEMDAFLSPNISADLSGNIDQIESLLLGGGNFLASPTQARALSSSSTTPATNHPTVAVSVNNAVHMSIQDNAKLPTFNLKVDRSNSSNVAIPAARGRRFIGATRKRPRPRSMSRESRDSSSLGTGLSSQQPSQTSSPIPKLAKQTDLPDHLTIDAATSVAIDEIMRLNENDMNLPELFLESNDRSSAALAYSFAGSNGTPQLPSSMSLDSIGSSEESGIPSQNMLPYKRVKPLPIPQINRASPPKMMPPPALQSALATAAKIAQASKVTDVAHILPTGESAASPEAVPKQAPDKTQQSMPPPVGIKRSTLSTSGRLVVTKARSGQLSASHTNGKTKASIAHATVQRSQFGFGARHTVPTVPHPPPANKKVARKPPSKFVPTSAEAAVAYERKKERAKKSRLRLNESIEELEVSIDLAGSQSQERYRYIAQTTMREGSDQNEKCTHHLARMMEVTIQQAEAAQKFDRPGFIGTGAEIIKSLNAQCEGLMKEVAYMRNLISSRRAIVPAVANANRSSPQRRVAVVTNSPELTPIVPDVTGKELTDAPNLLKRLAMFLDPKSLVKCSHVSKRWRRKDAFRNPELWQSLCIKRYGISAVRKWQNDEDVQINESNTALYFRMSFQNVKPFNSLEAPISLGMSDIRGKAGLWVSLMGRSNGETSRSVLQQRVVQGGAAAESLYVSVPVVELRLLVQNTGYSDGPVIVPDQQFVVDASTRRTSEKLLEVDTDRRFRRKVISTEGTQPIGVEMCRLGLYETAVISCFINARFCNTVGRFCERAKKMQILLSIGGTTQALPVPFSSHR